MSWLRLRPWILVVGIGCTPASPADGDGGTGGSDGTTSGMTSPPTTADTGLDSTGTASTLPTDDDDDDDDTTDSSSDDGPEPGLYEFDPTPVDRYTQIDRKGFPAVNTALNLVGDREAYNATSPVDDVAGDAALDNLIDSVVRWHEGDPSTAVPGNTGLDDDIAAQGWIPCDLSGVGDCVEQVGPFVIPDTLNLTLGDPSPFPNGRRPEEAVVDIILAIFLLDVGVPPAFGGSEPITQLLDQDDDGTPGPSLNPVANDVPFDDQFPYLAPAHE